MPDAATASADRELQLLEPLVECAHRLGMAFGRAAEAEQDRGAQLQLFDAFHRSFQAVRLGVRLSMTLRAPLKPATLAPVERVEREPLEIERPEPIELERLETERDRDRDYEPVSLPRFLATLGVVAADAERLPAEVSADALPTLKALLARANADPADPVVRPAAVALLTRSPPAAAKAALLGSASAPRTVALRGLSLARAPPGSRRWR